ncbi:MULTISPECIES: ABC transporter ATP-binding protein [unclassified Ensifer]|uniref:dipeptide ABC transporter ATP-binding protein n=1 Tax=unclassified Ensifer TaxID=2633371 RepID=UPI00081351E2|nr:MULTISPECIES: ABC transporter ATP-binding protein [unclassified Ensifer]OCP03064.1 ABC transporter ATP-binding protein [Ensifer sp. LC14]OCP08145.1 ABC transporter ATP-binding protein [Ensifer sp. LC11]OCP08816.1 ABC transporter ATP-binding protein [Ensifer sp. LC13]OCP32185.1 ABC transporter ATP-binding protein [Ensifer sp. LC499]
MTDTTRPVLDIRNLRVEYPLANGNTLVAVKDIDLMIRPGEIHALVGESGAGKTTVGNALMGLLQAPGKIAAGSIVIAGKEINLRTGRTEGIVPGRDVGAIFQDPMTSLNPLFTVESQLCEGMLTHLKLSSREAKARALDLMKAVGIPEPERRLGSYPHQLSGGQRQRVVIATALACNPQLIVADEPTTALDVSVQAQILKLIRDLADERGVGVLLVTHNMGVVAEIADRVTIMQNGAVVESGSTREVLTAPKAPYARTLIGAVPPIDVRLERLPVPSEETQVALDARASVRRKNAKSETGNRDDMVLSVRDLAVEYGARSLFRKASVFKAVKGVSFDVRRGEIFGLVGESGCGKTTVANTIAGLVTQSGGSINFQGTALGGRREKSVRQSLQMVFQDPYSALNPRLRINAAIAEPILFYKLASSADEARQDAKTLLEAVGLPADAGTRFAHAFSGGQRQRIAIARALGPRPSLLICDEPTSALDVSVQAQLLNLLKDLRDLAGLSMLFISHDLAVIRQMCDRVAVMKAGEIVELADTETLFTAPKHEYTRELLRLAPSVERILGRELASA